MKHWLHNNRNKQPSGTHSKILHAMWPICVFQCQPSALLRASGSTWIDGVKCGLFSNHAPLGGRPHYVWNEYLYTVREKVEVRVTVGVTVSVVLLCCVGWWWKEGRRWNPVPTHCLLFSKSTKGAARLNVPIRRTNRYQQYYMPPQHTYCGRVWNLILDCDVQSSN